MKAYSGKNLGSELDMASGPGTYTYIGSIFSSTKGKITYDTTIDGRMQVSVIPEAKKTEAFQAEKQQE